MPMTIKPALPTTTLQYARQLRRAAMTDAEKRLWQHLRAGRMAGRKFRRQHPIPPYIVDFCCVERMLIVELDGGQHSQEVDQTRTRWLESLGWRILRFWNHDVLSETDAVLDVIWNVVAASDPHPNPSPGGRGASQSES